METFGICLIIYVVGIIISGETFHAIYSEKGVWGDRIEYVWKTNLVKFSPIINIVYPLTLWFKGVYK